MFHSNSKPKKVIIFDWDDTICPSSFVDQMKVESFKDLPLHFQNQFKEIAKTGEKCLNEAAKFGDVIIITNSDDGWVKFSAERFVPSILPCLEKFPIVSARTRYERFYPNQPLCWKAAAFAHEVNEVFMSNGKDHKNGGDESMSTDVSSEDESEDNSPPPSKEHSKKVGSDNIALLREVISFGDSMEERTAVKIVASQLEATPKSVMFISSPSPTHLIGQLTMLTSRMEFVCMHDNALDLEISPQQAQKAAETYLQKVKTKVNANTSGGALSSVTNIHEKAHRIPSNF